MNKPSYIKSLPPDETDHGPPAAGRWKRTGDSVQIACPECGQPFDISKFGIAADGTVEPSIGRDSWHHKGCQWVSFIKLEGWRGGVRVWQKPKGW